MLWYRKDKCTVLSASILMKTTSNCLDNVVTKIGRNPESNIKTMEQIPDEILMQILTTIKTKKSVKACCTGRLLLGDSLAHSKQTYKHKYARLV